MLSLCASVFPNICPTLVSGERTSRGKGDKILELYILLKIA